jgi:hypothetical protein
VPLPTINYFNTYVGGVRTSLFLKLAIEDEMKNEKFKGLANNLRLAKGFPLAMWCK